MIEMVALSDQGNHFLILRRVNPSVQESFSSDE